ncbi:hypothetical protein DPMN_159706 [Dreissena polymorpha]|uniref:Uncharacterized protein n=1 Tax=Dreissena polymorpha TaxID=45954 RepID=A0A9D4EPP3_DREPO|nr:hypothetical protein DPMN_159706 [Dreissena polymorpha]
MLRQARFLIIGRIRPPVWSKDYFVSVSEQLMANTKITPRKLNMICPHCQATLEEAEYDEHVSLCKLKTVKKAPLKGFCNICNKTLQRKPHVKKHKNVCMAWEPLNWGVLCGNLPRQSFPDHQENAKKIRRVNLVRKGKKR